MNETKSESSTVDPFRRQQPQISPWLWHVRNPEPEEQTNLHSIPNLHKLIYKCFFCEASKFWGKLLYSHRWLMYWQQRCLFLRRKAMTNLDSILQSTYITLPTKVHLVKAMVFPVVTYGCDSWTIKKAESQRIVALELWCWRRFLRVPWTARRSNQSILKEVNPEYSLEELNMLKLKLQYFGHLMPKELTPWKRPWCWEGVKAKGEVSGRGWDG